MAQRSSAHLRKGDFQIHTTETTVFQLRVRCKNSESLPKIHKNNDKDMASPEVLFTTEVK